MDIGKLNDDYIACDVQRSSFYTYNGDDYDEDNGLKLGYGAYPPSLAVTFLKGAKQDSDGMDNPLTLNVQDALDSNGAVYPTLGIGFGDGVVDNEYRGMESFMYYNNSGNYLGDPKENAHFYNFLSGRWKDGSKMVHGNTGHYSDGGTIDTKYFFPGNSDPSWVGTKGIVSTPSIWTELNGTPSGNSNVPADRRGIGASGPFTFYPDSSITITVGLVFGRDYQNVGASAGVAVMKERIDTIINHYKTGYLSSCSIDTLGSYVPYVGISEIPNNKRDLIVYPNPFNDNIIVNYHKKNEVVNMTVYTLIGEKVFSKTISKKESTLRLKNLMSGVYILKIIDGNSILTQKIVKQ